MMIPLGQILSHGFLPAHIVCVQPTRTWKDLRQTISHIERQLSGGSTLPWLLAVDSTFYFVASLLACWQSGISVILSPDTQPGTLAQLRHHIHGIITDRPIAFTGILTLRVSGDERDASCNDFSETGSEWQGTNHNIERFDGVALELFTSGSTGERKRVAKTFAQLENEIAALQQQLRSGSLSLQTCSTVSHHHFYGLLFKVLWPLCCGVPFHERHYFFWEELLQRLPVGSVSIVSSPVHLRHLPQVARKFLRDWRETVIYSSGGPLPQETALEIMASGIASPTEVYGSTETGGVAFRQQAGKCRFPWQPLPGVSIKVESKLLYMKSLWLQDAADWFPTGDRAESAGNDGFHLLGRADQIVKILEKRVSLVEMDVRLSEHPLINEGRVLPLRSGKLSRIETLGAVIELNDIGKKKMFEHGKRSLVVELKRYLQQHFDPVIVPRRWRFVDELPRDTLGKVPLATLTSLFSKPTKPIIIDRERTASGCLLRLRVPENLAYVEGHFCQLGVVPGVCQLKWVIEEIEDFRGKKGVVTSMEALKFHNLLCPMQEFSMEFGLNSKTDKWSYRLFHGERKISSGRLQFAS